MPVLDRTRRTIGVMLLLTTALLGASACTASPPVPEVSTAADGAPAPATLPGFIGRTVEVDGVPMHYATGGDGPPLVLLHGWPENWYGWHDVMPALARHRTVYAVDLPGLAGTGGMPPDFSKRTLAGYLHGLLQEHLRLGAVDLAAHDLGAGVGFQYVARYRDSVRRYAHLDYPLPSAALPAATYRTFSWHLAFNMQPELPEQLVDDRQDVQEYLEAFSGQVAYGGTSFGGGRTATPFTDAELQEYVRVYGRPLALRAGFELYRTLGEDERDNDATGPVLVPTLLLTASGSMASTRPSVEALLPDLVRSEEVPSAGHWLMDENPEFVSAALIDFFVTDGQELRE